MELANLIITVLTPIIVIVGGFYLNIKVKKIEKNTQYELNIENRKKDLLEDLWASINITIDSITAVYPRYRLETEEQKKQRDEYFARMTSSIGSYNELRRKMLIVCIYLTEDFRGTLYNELNKMSSYIDDLKDIYNYKSTDPIGFEEELKTLHQRVFKILPNDLLDTHNKLMADFKRQLGILK